MIDPNIRDATEFAEHAHSPQAKLDQSLRPRRFDEYIGQTKIKAQLTIFTQAAKKRNEPLDHVLLHGPPGLGKTTLAYILSEAMGSQLHNTSGPVLERSGDLAALLTNLSENDVLFIDEIHRLSPVIEEMLYPAMEDRHIDIMIGEGPAARAVKLDLPPFTLVGATTRAGLLSNPLRDRFGIICHLEFYNTEALTKIVQRSANILSMDIDELGAQEVARRARGTPRIANRLLRRVRDFASASDVNKVDRAFAHDSLSQLEVDEHGLDAIDRKLLRLLIDRFQGGPAGLDTLCAALGDTRDTVEDVVEPYLIQQGILQRTARGRMVTAYGYSLLSAPLPDMPDMQAGTQEN